MAMALVFLRPIILFFVSTWISSWSQGPTRFRLGFSFPHQDLPSMSKTSRSVQHGFWVIWGAGPICELLEKSERNRSQRNQITYRQRLPKVCLQQFHGQDENWFGIFWALLVHFRLGIMCKEGICQIWIFRFLRSKGPIWKCRKNGVWM